MKDEVDQLRNKYKTDATAMQKLQEELITLEKAKANVEFEHKQLQVKFDQLSKNKVSADAGRMKLSDLQIRDKESADLQREREDRIRAESRSAEMERQASVLSLDLKNLNQKLERLEGDYQASQNKVMPISNVFTNP